jgi:GMP synthase (glutamine-hydrolysing)
LNAAHDGGPTRRNFRRELAADLVEFDVVDGRLPADFAFDGVVVTGSRSSVYDDEPWIDDLLDWLAAAVERDLPVLGVCYGHQALAEALGGRVEYMGEFEIGYRRVSRDDDELFDGIDPEFTVFTTHQDRVVDLPPGAREIARNDYGVHGFRVGSAWGVQFHPEYDRETAEEVTRGKEASIGADGVEDVLAGITPEAYDAACEAKLLFDNFVDYVADRAGEADAGVGPHADADGVTDVDDAGRDPAGPPRRD